MAKRELKITLNLRRLVLVLILIAFFSILIQGATNFLNGIFPNRNITSQTNITRYEPKTVNTDDWLTYENKDLGFLIKYPGSFYPESEPPEPYDVSFYSSYIRALNLPEEIQPKIQIFKEEISIENLKNEVNDARNPDQFPEFSEVQINGQTAYQTKAFDPEVIFVHTIVGNTDEAYIIELFTTEKKNDDLEDLYNTMLETFTIIN